jgi:hypothetical protein
MTDKTHRPAHPSRAKVEKILGLLAALNSAFSTM